jgi:adenylate cyclase class 2
VLSQRDTYFYAPHGRLKLREEAGAKAHLIAYERRDRAGQRQSRYRIVEIDEAEHLKSALASALGIKVVVAKERRLLHWEGVRIHLDHVEGLGRFIEFEAIAGEGEAAIAEAEAKVESLRRAFGLEDADLIGGSYCDLALAGRP